MHFASITLAGFTLATLCASMCPMNMGAMPMEHAGMDHGMHAMHMQENQGSAPCEHCEENELEEAAFLNTSTATDFVFLSLNFSPSALFESITYLDYELTGLSQITESRPPPLAHFITNKVVLRT